MKLAFVYAGQGSQKVGMGRSLYEAYPEFQAVFDSAPLEFDLKTLCFEGPGEVLSQTRYTQPCLLAMEIGVTELLAQRGVRPQAAAGLSLGEYGALHAAGVLDRESALKTIALRGRAMEEASRGLECGMTAVLGLERGPLEEACKEASELGVVRICNYNCPGQLVFGGERAAVDRAGALAKERGAKRCMPLNVSGPFHTPLMAPAGEVLHTWFRTVAFRSMELPVYFNCKGGPMEAEETIPDLLEQQVQSPVYWEDTIRRMEADGIDTVVEIGPGKTLCGFFKKTAPAIKTWHIETAEDLEEVVSALKGAGA